ncbi:MAG TPA: CARDB domain-containing protein [Chloroflexota bacterium]|nr:CARDB domain-containing protein [Chloroflexota bacterium]
MLKRRVTGPALGVLGLMLATLLTAREPSAYAADETPDLVVEATNVSPPLVELKVTNKSSNWANETTMVVQAVGQQLILGGIQPQVQMQTFPIENLDPGQSTTVPFVLQVPCLQHTLMVNVVPAGNYEDVKETNTTNNSISVPLCVSSASAQPAAGPDDLIDYGGCACPPAEKPKVEKAVSVRTSDQRMVTKHHQRPALPFDAPPFGSDFASGTVGWDQVDGNTDIVSLGIAFSNSFLDWSKNEVNSAVLTYTEQAERWTSGGGGNEQKPGCVTRIFTTRTIDVKDDFRAEFLQAVDPGSHNINLTQYLQQQNATGNAPILAFVLRGAMDSVDGDDETSCLSRLDNIVLDIKFEPR